MTRTNGPTPSRILAEQLEQRLASFGPVVVAFSGGVDSSVVAAAAHATSSDAIAVTAISPSVASWQRVMAREVAAEIGIKHHLVETGELTNLAYRRNDGQRCFHCKSTLYEAIGSMTDMYPESTIVSGTNVDDLGDYRPGLRAGKLAGVETPLADLQITKSAVRDLAVHYGLSNQALPASPCLASRIAYGIEVTPERLDKVDRAEAWVRQLGFTDVRVRCENDPDRGGDVARIEVPIDEVSRLIQLDADHRVTQTIGSHGFNRVTIDSRGLRSGNLNESLATSSTHDIPSSKSSVAKTPLLPLIQPL